MCVTIPGVLDVTQHKYHEHNELFPSFRLVQICTPFLHSLGLSILPVFSDTSCSAK